MKKVDTKSKEIVIEQDGLKVRGWEKTCVVCKKRYQTASRSQKYCCEECAKKAGARKRKQKKEYDSTKEIVRLSARSHSVANEVVRQLVALNIIEYKCECGAETGLQVHHRNLNWLDNTPSNLQILCPKCHANIHSSIEEKVKQDGKRIVDLYDESFLPILSILNKNI